MHILACGYQSHFLVLTLFCVPRTLCFSTVRVGALQIRLTKHHHLAVSLSVSPHSFLSSYINLSHPIAEKGPPNGRVYLFCTSYLVDPRLTANFFLLETPWSDILLPWPSSEDPQLQDTQKPSISRLQVTTLIKNGSTQFHCKVYADLNLTALTS